MSTASTTARVRHLARLLLLACVGVVVAAPAVPQGNTPAGSTHAITRSHIGAGGGRSQSSGPGAYQLTGTIAQPAPGYAVGGSHQVDGGFWHANRPELLFSDGFEDSPP